jgi:hypothetical protein
LAAAAAPVPAPSHFHEHNNDPGIRPAGGDGGPQFKDQVRVSASGEGRTAPPPISPVVVAAAATTAGAVAGEQAIAASVFDPPLAHVQEDEDDDGGGDADNSHNRGGGRECCTARMRRRRVAALVGGFVVALTVVLAVVGVCFVGDRCSAGKGTLKNDRARQEGPAAPPSPTTADEENRATLAPSSPSQPPSTAPTAQPTRSAGPTIAPSASPAPTQQCGFDLLVDGCTGAVDTSLGSAPCDATCTGRPTGATLLFQGGPCNSSANDQTTFACQDGANASLPPFGLGDLAHILVTDSLGNNLVYFNGTVAVGEYYTLFAAGTRLDPNLRLTVRAAPSSNGTTGPLYQDATFDATCSREPLSLGNRFGASLLAGFSNQDQGIVVAGASVPFRLALSLPITADTRGDKVTFSSLVADLGFNRTFDLSPDVAGTTISKVGDVLTTFEHEVDVFPLQGLNFSFVGEGVRNNNGTLCEGDGNFSITTLIS